MCVLLCEISWGVGNKYLLAQKWNQHPVWQNIEFIVTTYRMMGEELTYKITDMHCRKSHPAWVVTNDSFPYWRSLYFSGSWQFKGQRISSRQMNGGRESSPVVVHWFYKVGKCPFLNETCKLLISWASSVNTLMAGARILIIKKLI